MTCHHKTTRDHSREVDGRKVWRCSVCCLEFKWHIGSSYYGSIECTKCWAADIEFVACSVACAVEMKRLVEERRP